MSFSVIVPVYNNPKQVEELFQSLVNNLKHCGHYTEVIIVEDGSTILSEDVCEKFREDLLIKYYRIPNSGPGAARNFAVQHSVGEYLIFLDADVILPPGYLQAVLQELYFNAPDAFGGTERSNESFTSLQRAMCYTTATSVSIGLLFSTDDRTSLLYPRTFNMGIRRDAFDDLGGFANMKYGEDIELTLRIFNGKKSYRQFPNAWVYHKRVDSIKTFAEKTFKIGKVCSVLSVFNPKYRPLIDIINFVRIPLLIGLVLLAFFRPGLFIPIFIFFSVVIAKATKREKSLLVGLWAAVTSVVYVFSFGLGYIVAKFRMSKL